MRRSTAAVGINYRKAQSPSPSPLSGDLGGIVRLLPNPASHYFSLRFDTVTDAPQAGNIEVIDALGKIVLTATRNSEMRQHIALTGVANGMYFVRIVSESGQVMNLGKLSIMQ